MTKQKYFQNFILLLILFIIITVPARGLMREVPVDELLKKSPLIIAGMVFDKTCHWSEEKNEIYTLVYIQVSDVIKGDLTTNDLIIKLPGGEWDGMNLFVSDTPGFEVGEQVLGFFSPFKDHLNRKNISNPEAGSQVYRVVEKFQGKYSLDPPDYRRLTDILLWQGRMAKGNLSIYKELINQLKEKSGVKRPLDGLIVHPTYTYMAGGAHWAIGTTVNYKINANCSDVTTEASAVISAGLTWSALNPSAFRFNYTGSTSITSTGMDGTVVVFWDPTPNGSVLATSSVWWSGSTIVHTDLRFRDNWTWYTNGSSYDIETVALHEWGHSVGLGHDVGIMAPSYGGVARTVDSDNRNGFYSLYGNPTVATATITDPSNGAYVMGTKTIKMSVQNSSDLDYLDLFIKNVKKKTFTSSPFTYSWDTTQYSEGQVTVKATAVSDSGDSNSHQIKVTVDNIHTLAVSIVPKGSGTVSVSPDKNTYDHNEQVTLTGTPTGRYVFLKWQNDLSGNKNPNTFKILRDKKVTARFNLPPVVKITSPLSGETIWGKTLIQANASDSDGIESVKIYVDNKLKKTDISKNYSYLWDTVNSGIGLHTLKAVAVDKVGLTSFDEISVIVSKIKLTISGVRKTISSWLFTKDYGELTMTLENPNNIPVTDYVIYRKESGGFYQEIHRFKQEDFVNNQFIYQNKYLQAGKTFIFKVTALGGNGQTLGSSPEMQL